MEKSQIASKIAQVEGSQTQEFRDDDDAVDDSSSSNQFRIDETAIEAVEETVKSPSPPPILNNRVKVIQSIGNPNKHQQQLAPPEVVKVQEKPSPTLPQKPQDIESEIKLPPKKKAIAIGQPSTSSNVSVPKPKYDPIQHYRKILLGFSKDDDHPTTIEENIEDEESVQEPQVFPVHWRKRTSQNFLFRR